MKRIFLLVDDIVKAKFFIDFDREDTCVFITNKPSCYFFLKMKNAKHIIFLKSNSNIRALSVLGVEQSVAVLNGRQLKADAFKNFLAMFDALESRLKNNITNQDTLVIFNGNNISSLASIQYFKSFGSKVLFCEISNLPKKMIFDPCGVNAQSYLYKNPAYLDELPAVDIAKHNAWIASYLEYKCKPIPQSYIRLKNYLPIAVDDFLTRIGLCIKEDSLSFFCKLKMFVNKFNAKVISNSYKLEDLSENFVFFPTQVKSDTQLKINSDIDNISALKKIIATEKLPIYVKVHPAESDVHLINEYIGMNKRGEIKLVSNGTIDLVKSAVRVYTINSTVGLEAMMLKKEVITFGRAIYSNFDFERVQKYIHHYLVPLNFFSSNIIDDCIIVRLDSLAELKFKRDKSC